MRTTDIARRLLATASALALSTAAHAACTANQAPLTATAGTGCITFNDGGTHTGAVTNPAGVTLAGTGAVAPTGTGISVRKASTLNGIITNNGTITSQSAFGIAAAGANTVIVGDIVNNGAIDNHNSTHLSIFVNTGVSLQAGAGGSGSIINNGSLTANSTSTGNAGIGVFSSALAGSITNAANATINARAGIRFDNFTNAIVGSGKVSLGGSIVNAGTVTTLNVGIEVVGTNPVAGRPSTTGTLATISGGILNSGTITSGAAGVFVLATDIGGDINNTKVITSATNGIDISSLGQLPVNGQVVRFSNPSIGGSILNSGTITGGNGSADIFALSATIAGGIVNNGSLVGGTLGGSGIVVSDATFFSGQPSVSVGGRAS